ncbi:MAG: DUF4209 domain-containing protein [Oscillospiraceae bacterium]|jgi:hypothetical protein|nr:DUF4209 domain-containing protein [Oscillospiraceae bacterium]
MKYYEDIGDKKNKNSVKVKIDELNLETTKNLGKIKFDLNIEEFFNFDKEKLQEKTLIETLVFCGFKFGYYILNTETKAQFEKEVCEYSQTLVGMVSKNIIDNKGNTVFTLNGLDSNNYKKDEKLFEQYMYYIISRRENFIGISFIGHYEHIRNSFPSISENDLDSLINNNKFIPEDRKEIFKRGIIYGFKGQWLEFLSLMCPQIENFYREIIVFCGGTDNTYKQNYTQQEYFTLGSVLDNETLNEYYKENIILILKAILNEKAGSNLRNRVAHGLINDDEANSGISIWLLFFVIMLCCWNNSYAVEILEKLNKKEQEE